MIFLTIGSHEPFDRLVAACDEWCADHPDVEMFGQIAHVAADGYRPRHFRWVETMPPADYQARFDAARLIIAHAGMGSIITALGIGKPLVIMPRRGHLKETRNDHQYATAKRFRGRPGLFVADDERQLAAAIDEALAAGAPGASSIERFAQPQLIEAIRSAIVG